MLPAIAPLLSPLVLLNTWSYSDPNPFAWYPSLPYSPYAGTPLPAIAITLEISSHHSRLVGFLRPRIWRQVSFLDFLGHQLAGEADYFDDARVMHLPGEKLFRVIVLDTPRDPRGTLHAPAKFDPRLRCLGHSAAVTPSPLAMAARRVAHARFIASERAELGCRSVTAGVPSRTTLDSASLTVDSLSSISSLRLLAVSMASSHSLYSATNSSIALTKTFTSDISGFPLLPSFTHHVFVRIIARPPLTLALSQELPQHPQAPRAPHRP